MATAENHYAFERWQDLLGLYTNACSFKTCPAGVGLMKRPCLNADFPYVANDEPENESNGPFMVDLYLKTHIFPAIFESQPPPFPPENK